MRTQVSELKAEKEVERQKFVAEMKEKQFKAQADELRKVDWEFNELKTVHERNI